MFGIKTLVIGGALAVAAAIAIGGGVWWFFIRDTAHLATTAPAIPTDLVTGTSGTSIATISGSGSGPAAQTAQAAGAPTVAPDAGSSTGGQTYAVLSDRSEAAYFADETLASIGLPSTAKGSTTKVSGTFHLTTDGTALDTSQPSMFTVDLTSLKSDKSMRDRRVQNTLETGTYPTATFTAGSATGYDPGIAAGQEQSLKLTGILDLHGVKKEVTWDVKARKAGNVITALATVTFPFEDFSMSPPSIGGFVSVQDHITLQVQLIAQAS